MTERIQQAIEKAVDIDTLPAGREMDALVARAMGWTHNASSVSGHYGIPEHWVTPEGQTYRSLPPWSISIAAAWKVWNWAKQNEDRWEKFIWALPGSRSGIHSLCRELTPLAICRAAWKAKEQN